MLEDISGERGEGGSIGWVRVSCDAPACTETVEGRPALGEDWPAGWAYDLSRTPATTSSVRHYCPVHAGFATV